jgi:predicted Zn-dependent protease
VILEPQAVADLLGYFASAFDARLAEEGRSAFSAPGGTTRIGRPVADERLSFYSDPWSPELPGPAAAENGVPAQKLHLIRNGVLENLVYSRFWAEKKGKRPTPGPVNAILEGNVPPRSVDDMIAATERGLLASRFWYLRMVDPRAFTLTGLTRDGVWYVENGKIQHPVRNFRFNQSILEMLAPGNVELIGAPERVSSTESQGLGSLLLPPLKVKAFHFTSTSEAV